MFGRDRVIRAHVRSRFVVTLKTGEAFEGLLDDADSSTLVLVDASAVAERGRARVDGHLFLARGDVAYMQIPAVAALALPVGTS